MNKIDMTHARKLPPLSILDESFHHAGHQLSYKNAEAKELLV
jgi:hypothetical protein